MAKNIVWTANKKETSKPVIDYFNYLNEKNKGKQKDYLISIKENRPIRSLAQNRYWHAIKKIVAIETGHTENEIENMFKMERWYETVFYPSGKSEKIPKDTHDRDTVEFTSMLHNFKQWAREHFPNVIITEKKDMTYKVWLDIESSYDESFFG